MTEQQPSKEYIHSLSIGDLNECKLKAQELIKILDNLYDTKKIEGWETLIIKNEDMVESNYILTDPSKIANYKYPYLFVAVQHNKVEYVEISEYFHINGFIEILE